MRDVTRFLLSLEELSDWNLEGVGQLHERGNSQILFTALDCACERSGEAALMRKLFLGPFPLLSKCSHAVTKVLAYNRGILHPPYDQATVEYRPRSIVGRSVVGIASRVSAKDGIVTADNASDGSRLDSARSNHVPALAIGGLVLALAGFAVGRAYPTHDYRPFSTGGYMYDGRTGKACNPFREAQDRANVANALDPNDPWAAVDSQLSNPIDRALKTKTAADTTPACGSE